MLRFALMLLLGLTTLVLGCVRQTSWIESDFDAEMMPEIRREFRGLWVATVDNIDWPSEPGLSSEQQRSEALAIIELADELNLNAILLQIRPSADAVYRSRLEPWSAFLTGRQGQSPGYDPLQYWITEAHARGIELHAWINPFRAWHPSIPGDPSPRSIVVRHPDLVRNYGDLKWLDPGEPAARAHSLAVIADIVRRYDIDGIMLDDYFYPYPINDEPFPDDVSYARFTESGGSLSRKDWRRWNIDRFVRDFGAEVKRIRPDVLVGISPFGIWRPGHPPEVTGFDAYDQLSADARRWMHEGWLDVSSPQLYWRHDAPSQPFEALLSWWQKHNAGSRFLWPSLFLTRIKQDSGWAPDEIVAQIRTIRENHATGFVLFSAIGLLENRQHINEALLDGPLEKPAIVPQARWLPGEAPRAPNVRITQDAEHTTIRWHAVSSLDRDVRGWIIGARYAGRWETTRLPPAQRSIRLDNHEGTDALLTVAVWQVGAGGRIGEPRVMNRLIPPPALPTASPRPAPRENHQARTPAATTGSPAMSDPD